MLFQRVNFMSQTISMWLSDINDDVLVDNRLDKVASSGLYVLRRFVLHRDVSCGLATLFL